jgi:OOP family OmpA-OmpF porin
MRKTRRTAISPRLAALVVGTVILTAATACGSTDPPSQPKADGTSHATATGTGSSGSRQCAADTDGAPVGLVIGKRANSVAPDLPDAVNTLIDDAVAARATIVVTEADGSPTTQYVGEFTSTSENSAGIQQDEQTYEANLEQEVRQLAPKAAQADDLDAIARTADQMHGRGTIIVVDSGLQTLAPLDFRIPGMLEAAPGDIAGYLAKHDDLPHLSGIHVVLVGIGQTASPQSALGIPLTDNLKAIWQAMMQSAGACSGVQFEPNPTVGADTAAAAGYPAVGVVPVPQPPSLDPCGSTVLQDSGTVGFTPGSTDFRDPSAARSTLEAYVAKIQPFLPGTTIQVVGTTASWGGRQYQLNLSQQRAQTVADELESLGIPAADLKVDGVGTDWPTHVNDLEPSGALNPVLAEQNRTVVLVGHCTGTAAS